MGCTQCLTASRAAADTAALILTTETVVADKPEPGPAHAADPPGGTDFAHQRPREHLR